MPSGFPGSIDNFTDPLSNSPLNSPSHSGLHADVNDAVEKIETYMGLVKVIPTSATNGTVSARGTVTFTNVASVTINGAFTAGYNSYKMVWRINSTGTSAAELRARLAIAGTATATSYIAGMRIFNPNVGTSTIDGNASTTTHFPIGNVGEPNFLPSQGEALIVNPFTTSHKGLSGNGSGLNSGVIYTVNWFGGVLVNTTAHDGIQLFASTNNITGTVNIYGFRE